jgi:hypothetical protein
LHAVFDLGVTLAVILELREGHEIQFDLTYIMQSHIPEGLPNFSNHRVLIKGKLIELLIFLSRFTGASITVTSPLLADRACFAFGISK